MHIQTNSSRAHSKQKWCHRTICLGFLDVFYVWESLIFVSIYICRCRNGYDQFSFVTLLIPLSLASLIGLILWNAQLIRRRCLSKLKPYNCYSKLFMSVELQMRSDVKCYSIVCSSSNIFFRTRHNTRDVCLLLWMWLHTHACLVHSKMYILNPRALNLLVCNCALRGTSQKTFSPLFPSSFSHVHAIFCSNMLNVWTSIKCSMRLLLFSWTVILRWRWQCFAFEFSKHNYICSWKLHGCCQRRWCCCCCCCCDYYYCCSYRIQMRFPFTKQTIVKLVWMSLIALQPVSRIPCLYACVFVHYHVHYACTVNQSSGKLSCTIFPLTFSLLHVVHWLWWRYCTHIFFFNMLFPIPVPEKAVVEKSRPSISFFFS